MTNPRYNLRASTRNTPFWFYNEGQARKQDFWRQQVLKCLTPEAAEQLVRANVIRDYARIYPLFSRKDIPQRREKNITYNAWDIFLLSGEPKAIEYAVQEGHVTNRYLSEQGLNPLELVAYLGSPDALHLIKTLTQFPTAEDDDLFSLLSCAALGGNVTLMKHVIGAKKFPEHYANSLLRTAAAGGSVAAMRFCVEELHADPQQVNENYENALYLATSHGNVAAMRYAVNELGISPLYQFNTEAASAMNFNALVIAALSGNVKAMEVAVNEFHIAPDSSLITGSGALFSAAASGNPQAVSYALTKLKLDPNRCVTDQGVHPILAALMSGNRECVELIAKASGIKEGDFLEVDDPNNHPLLFAADGGNVELMEWVLKHYKTVTNHTDERGMNALLRSAYGGKLAAMKYCVDVLKLNPHHRDEYGFSLVSIVADSGNVAALRYVIETLGVDWRQKTDYGMNVLDFALCGRNLKSVIYLRHLGLEPTNYFDIELQSRLSPVLQHALSVPREQLAAEFPSFAELFQTKAVKLSRLSRAMM